MSSRPLPPPLRSVSTWGFASLGLLVLAVALPALAYRGRAGEPFSFLNHFISELGETGVSPLAAAFNAGLVLGGLLLVPFCVLLGLSMRRNPLAKLGMAIGVAAAIFCALVGLFPMNEMKSHLFAAMNFFRLGLAMVFIFTLAVFLQPPAERILPNWVNWAGALAAACFALFLWVVPRVAKLEGKLLDPSVFPVRPSPLPLAVSEWSIYFSTLFWILLVSASLARSRAAVEAPSGAVPADVPDKQPKP